MLMNVTKTKLFRQNNTTYTFIHHSRVISVVASNVIQAERAVVDQLKRNN